MVLEQQVMTAEDAGDFARIENAAFADGVVSELLSPPPFTEEQYNASVERIRDYIVGHPYAKCMKVVDTDIGKTIACSKWEFYPNGRTQEEIDETYSRRPQPPGCNKAFVADFFEYLNESRKRVMGTQPFVFLHILVVHPDHHRRGAGSMLLKWGVEEADKLSLRCHLEATEKGKPLYERFGFEAKEKKVFKFSDYDPRFDTEDVNWLMLRQPQGVATQSQKLPDGKSNPEVEPRESALAGVDDI